MLRFKRSLLAAAGANVAALGGSGGGGGSHPGNDLLLRDAVSFLLLRNASSTLNLGH